MTRARTSWRLNAALTLGVLGAAAVLLLPMRGDAFNTNGAFVGLGQRDFRIFNNFTSPFANDNTTPDPNFPGYTGAPLAIWKACVEWGSRLHGNGDGDPSQPFDLGSGGANWDASFQGLATGVGGPDDNIHSQITGSSPGVFAFTEVPGTDGWRIRYYANWTWSDGPDALQIAGQTDLQGVATHEFGHALGLDHSSVSTATMRGAIQATGVPMRSLDPDDANGIRFVYGPAVPTKPIITGVALTPGVITISGSGFWPWGNEVWFTRGVPNANVAVGDPIKLTGIYSQNGGTLISVSVPPEAGPGDVFVRIIGTESGTLSNGWPADVSAGVACPSPVNSCTTAPNSVGAGAVMSWSGATYLSQNNFVLRCTGLRPGANGFFLAGQIAQQVPFCNGTSCVGGSAFAFPMQAANFLGSLYLPLDATTLPAGMFIQPGTTWYFQAIYRDNRAGGALCNASDALTTVWCQ